MFSADIAGTKLRPVSFTTRAMAVDGLRFTSFAGRRPHHTLIFLPGLLLDYILDDFFQLTRLKLPVSAELLHISKNGSRKSSIAHNRLFHRHSKPAKQERYETRQQSGISTQTTGHDDDGTNPPVLVPPIK